jgi:hypothetical protein
MDKTQLGVMRGMGLAILTAVAAFAFSAAYGSRIWTIGPDLASRASLASWAVVFPAFALFVCIARLAKHRFFTPADIHGSGLTGGTDKAKLLQALLQNTLEQSCLALPVYFATSIVAPASLLAVVPAAAAMFFAGRLFFFAGYAKGAPARAFGFGLTFYPTVLLLLYLVVLGLSKAAS